MGFTVEYDSFYPPVGLHFRGHERGPYRARQFFAFQEN